MIDWLLSRFGRDKGRQAIVARDRGVTYGELLGRVESMVARLRDEDVPPGASVSIEGDYTPDAIALLLALIANRNVVVPLTPSVPAAQQARFREIAEVALAASSASSASASPASPDPSRESPVCLRRLGPGRHVNPIFEGLAGAPGLVLFSSGSTGEPKAALHNFTKLLEKFKVERRSMRTLTFLLFDHIGGLNTLFYVLSNCGTLVLTADRNADAVCSAIARHKVELLPTSPTFLNLLLLSEAWRRHDLSSLKQITYGTEPMGQATLARVHEALPGVDLLQTYGLSELGILRSKSESSTSLLVKIGGEGFETKVVDGTLRIRAQSSMLGYLNAPSPFDAEGWFDTGDEVTVQGDFLRIHGRRSELINVGGEKVYPVEVEGVLLALDNVVDATVRGEANPITGQGVVATLTLRTPEDPVALRSRVRAACRAQLAPYKVPVKVEVADALAPSARFKKLRKTS